VTRRMVGHVVVMLETTDEVEITDEGASHFVRSFKMTPSTLFVEPMSEGLEPLPESWVKTLEVGAMATLVRAAHEKLEATMKPLEQDAFALKPPEGPLS
jgi:hypothetical protein